MLQKRILILMLAKSFSRILDMEKNNMPRMLIKYYCYPKSLQGYSSSVKLNFILSRVIS